jgi:hypothetical protein
MADVVLVAVILAFFVAAGLLVRALGRVADDTADMAEPDEDDARAGTDERRAGAGRLA